MKRRQFVTKTAQTSLALTFLGAMACKEQTKKTTEETIKEVVSSSNLDKRFTGEYHRVSD